MTKALELAKFGRESAPTGLVVGDSDAQTLSQKTFSDMPTFSSGTANGIPYLNGSKVLTTASGLVFDGVNLGIGQASPTVKLHVNAVSDAELAVARIGVTSSGGVLSQLKVLADPANGIVKFDATGSVSNNIQFLSGGTFRAQLNSSGYLSLGTTSATEVLTVHNSNYEIFGLYRNLDYNSVGAMGVRMYFGGYVGSTPTRSAAIDGTLMTATTGRLSFSTLIGGTLTEAVRIDTNGSVRIGGTFAAQSSTNEKLTVDGTSSQAATLANSSDTYGTIYVKNNSKTAATIQPYLYFNDGDGGNRGGFGVKYTDASTHQFAQGGFNWYTGSSGFSGLAATLNATGLGLGTAPNSNGRLTVYETTVAKLFLTDSTLGTSYGGQVRGYGTTGAGGYLELGVVDANSFNSAVKVFNQATQISFSINSGSNGATSERMRIDNTGAAHFYQTGAAAYGGVNLTSADPFIRFTASGGTTDKKKWDIRAIGATGSEALEFRTINDANTVFSTKLWIANSGNIGIGTTAPAVEFEVRGRARVGDGTNTLTIGYWDGVNNRIESVNKPLFITSYTEPIKFGISGSENVRISSTGLSITSGNLGVGEAVFTTPYSSINFVGDVLIGGNLYNASMGKNLYYSSGWKYKTAGYNGALFDTDGLSFHWYSTKGTTGTAGGTAAPVTVMQLDGSGNLSIGGTGSASRLHVQGTSAAITLESFKPTVGFARSIEVCYGESGSFSTITIQVNMNGAGGWCYELNSGGTGNGYTSIGGGYINGPQNFSHGTRVSGGNGTLVVSCPQDNILRFVLTGTTIHPVVTFKITGSLNQPITSGDITVTFA